MHLRLHCKQKPAETVDARTSSVGQNIEDEGLGLPPLQSQLPAPWQTSEWVDEDGRRVTEMSCGSFSLQARGANTEPAVISEEIQSLPTENDGVNTVNPMDIDWNPPEIIEAIKLCREFLRRKIVYTGRTENANTFARILPLYQGFVEKNLSFFAEKFGYVPFKNKPGGAKGAMFATFRDEILPPALAQLQVRSDLDSMSTLSDKTQHMKRDVKNSGHSSMRCIVGWEVVNRS